MSENLTAPRQKKPEWLRVKLPVGKKYKDLRGLVDKYKLNTICTSGSCPNMGECWGEGTATFMILGNICTRSCGFCGVKNGKTRKRGMGRTGKSGKIHSFDENQARRDNIGRSR